MRNAYLIEENCKRMGNKTREMASHYATIPLGLEHFWRSATERHQSAI